MRLLRLLHAWSGLVMALLLAALGLAGALTALRPEIIAATIPAASGPPPAASTYGPALAAYEDAHPDQIRSVKFSPGGIGVHRLYLAGGRAAYIDAKGEELANWGKNGRIEDLAFAFHHTLLAGPKGEQAVGVIGVLGVGLALAGLLVWWPARHTFSLRLWPASLQRRDLLGVHRNLGVLLALVLVVQFVSGAAVVFEGSIRRWVGDSTPQTPTVAAQTRDWAGVLASARAAAPAATIKRVFAPPKPDLAYTVYMQEPGETHPEGVSRLFFDGQGRLLGRYDAMRSPIAERILNSALAVHSGEIGGDGLRWAFALVGAGLTILSLMGAASFLVNRTGRRR